MSGGVRLSCSAAPAPGFSRHVGSDLFDQNNQRPAQLSLRLRDGVISSSEAQCAAVLNENPRTSTGVARLGSGLAGIVTTALLDVQLELVWLQECTRTFAKSKNNGPKPGRERNRQSGKSAVGQNRNVLEHAAERTIGRIGT